MSLAWSSLWKGSVTLAVMSECRPFICPVGNFIPFTGKQSVKSCGENGHWSLICTHGILRQKTNCNLISLVCAYCVLLRIISGKGKYIIGILGMGDLLISVTRLNWGKKIEMFLGQMIKHKRINAKAFFKCSLHVSIIVNCWEMSVDTKRGVRLETYMFFFFYISISLVSETVTDSALWTYCLGVASFWFRPGICLFMAAGIAWVEAMLMLLAQCFTGESAVRKGKGNRYKWSLLSHRFTGVMRTAPVAVCAVSERGGTWRLKRTRFSEVDSG